MTLPVSSQCQPCSFGLQLLQAHVHSSNLVLTLGLVLAGRGWQDPAGLAGPSAASCLPRRASCAGRGSRCSLVTPSDVSSVRPAEHCPRLGAWEPPPCLWPLQNSGQNLPQPAFPTGAPRPVLTARVLSVPTLASPGLGPQDPVSWALLRSALPSTHTWRGHLTLPFHGLRGSDVRPEALTTRPAQRGAQRPLH